MVASARSGVVIFTGNKGRLATFYQAMTGLAVRAEDADVTVLASDAFELVIHTLRGEHGAAHGCLHQAVLLGAFARGSARKGRASGRLVAARQRRADGARVQGVRRVRPGWQPRPVPARSGLNSTLRLSRRAHRRQR